MAKLLMCFVIVFLSGVAAGQNSQTECSACSEAALEALKKSRIANVYEEGATGFQEDILDGVHENITDPHIQMTVPVEKDLHPDRPPMKSRARNLYGKRAAKITALNTYTLLTRNKRKDFYSDITSMKLYSDDT